MAKNNPLFVDSTKFHGDRIGSQIELTNVLPYEGEQLIAQIVDHQGDAHKVPMQMLEDGTYVARVWLQHQRVITLRFVIEREGEVLFQTASREARAQYAIIEDWEPVLEANEDAVERVESVHIPLPDTPWTADYATTVESLIEKWGL